MSEVDPITGEVLDSENTRVEQPTDQQIIPFVGDSLEPVMHFPGMRHLP